MTVGLKKPKLILLQLKYSSFKTLKYRSNILLMFKIYYAFDRNEFLTLRNVNSDFCLNLALILASPVSVLTFGDYIGPKKITEISSLSVK